MALEQCHAQERELATKNSDNRSGSFDCNICLDHATDPIVTLCGHLYCWPCIYKWFHTQKELPQCPVCKSQISDTAIVPLYGKGEGQTEADFKGKRMAIGMAIPPRPSACGTRALEMETSPSHSTRRFAYYNLHNQNQRQPYRSFEVDSLSPLSNLSPGHPFVGMFGEMVYARVFGNARTIYAYPSSDQLVGRSSFRLRRQEMQAAKSLNRVSGFLLCCFLLCLLLF